jgi:2-polyprenyl-6-methoxyphenol hydroxylase-like FAD-dependent oxidoreductase
VRDRIGLLGDAAHAATPNLGQGAGQAIEDARILAYCLAHWPVTAALRQYRDRRYRKASGVVTTSRRIGQLAHLRSAPLRGLRDGLLRLTPPGVGHRQLERLLRLDAFPEA